MIIILYYLLFIIVILSINKIDRELFFNLSFHKNADIIYKNFCNTIGISSNRFINLLLRTLNS